MVESPSLKRFVGNKGLKKQEICRFANFQSYFFSPKKRHPSLLIFVFIVIFVKLSKIELSFRPILPYKRKFYKH